MHVLTNAGGRSKLNLHEGCLTMNDCQDNAPSKFDSKLAELQTEHGKTEKQAARHKDARAKHLKPVDETRRSLHSCIWGNTSHPVVRFSGEKLLIDLKEWAKRWKEFSRCLTKWPGVYILDVVETASGAEDAAREILRDAARQPVSAISGRMEEFRAAVGHGEAIGLSYLETVGSDLALWTFLRKLEVLLADPQLMKKRLGKAHEEFLAVLADNPERALLGKHITGIKGLDLNNVGRELRQLVLLGYATNTVEGYAITNLGLEILGLPPKPEPADEK